MRCLLPRIAAFWVVVLLAALGGSASADSPTVTSSPPGTPSLQGGPYSPSAADSKVLLSVADSTICSGLPGSVDNTSTLSVEGFVSNVCNALLRFDLSSLPANAVIDSASLALWLNTGGCNLGPCPYGVPTNARLVTAPWNETSVTWNTRPSVQSGGVSKTVSDADVDTYHGWDITAFARAWHTGTSANYGVEVRCPSVDLGYYLYFSSREGAHSPFLGVVYHTVPLCDAVAQIPKAECQALVDLYNGTGGSSWTHKTGWLVTNTPCSWYGVSCSGGHVSELNLNSNHLVGTIPSTLSNLPSLQDLAMSTNQLGGSIPSSLGSLPLLRFLNLSGNQLTGGIPTSLGSLSDLEGLWLGANQLTGSIPTSLGSLTKLQNLELSQNQLGGNIPTSLGALSNLRQLLLHYNQLTGGIPSNLGSLANLTDLYLNSNQLTGSIPTGLGSLSKLERLVLSNNQLIGSIPSVIGNMPSLVGLFVDSNPLSGALPTSLKNLALIAFHFNDTNLCEPPDAGFQAWLASIPSLQRTNVKCSSATSTPSSTPTRTRTRTPTGTRTRTPTRTARPGTKAYLPIIMKQWRVPAPTSTPTRTATLHPIFSDNFNNGLLTGWTANKGVWTNPGTYMRGTDTDPPGYEIRNVRSVTGSNFVYEGTVNLVSGYSVGLIFRASTDGTHGYEVGLSTVDNQFKLGVVTASSYAQLAYAPLVVQYGHAYRVKIVANGSLIEVYLDGVKKLTATNSQYSSGRFGVIVRGGLYSYQGIANFDNLVAKSLP